MDRIAELRDKLNAALDDAERDGGELVYGLARYYRRSNGPGAWCGCLIGCAVGDVPFFNDDEPMEPEAFADRYGLPAEFVKELEMGFERGRGNTPPARLGVEFRERARRV